MARASQRNDPLARLRHQPLDERRARLLAALIRVTLRKDAATKNGGKRPRLH